MRKATLLLSMGVTACLSVILLLFFMSISFSPLASLPASDAPASVKTVARPTVSQNSSLQNGDIQWHQAQTDSEAALKDTDFSGTLRFSETEILTTIVDLSNPYSLAEELALAMDIAKADIIEAKFMCNDDTGACTDPRAAAVLGTAPGTWFPTRGHSFALLSTGLATDVHHVATLTLPLQLAFDFDNPTFDYSTLTETTISTVPMTLPSEMLDEILDDSQPISGVAPIFDPSHMGASIDWSQLPTLTFTSFVDILTEQNQGSVLDGMTNTLGTDLVQLHVALKVPENVQCLSFDYTFYTVDIPVIDDKCSDNYGDFFTTQLNISNTLITTDGFHTKIDAPGNFVTHTGKLVATTTMAPAEIEKSLTSPVGTTIPGVFPLLQARQQVSPNTRIDLFFSIQDMGDSYGNSAVAIDNFTWLKSAQECMTDISGDTDGDGLPNGWETYGKYTRNRAGELKYFDLPSWGADPKIKDIFVEVDTMVFTDSETPIEIYPGESDPVVTFSRPISRAIDEVVKAFEDAPVDASADPSALKPYQGIRLHVDYDPEMPPRWMDEDALPKPWKELSEGGIISVTELMRPFICDKLCETKWDDVWKEVQVIKYDYNQFADERMPIFHYALFAHMLSYCTKELNKANDEVCQLLPKISGASNHITDIVNGGSDFAVTMGHSQWHTPDEEARVTQQAGTFMHELGHNLGLNHEGSYTEPTPVPDKPNHLSVMNYLYQISGVLADRPIKFDYSRYDFTHFPLSEKKLSEEAGIRLEEYQQKFGISIPVTISIPHYCERTSEFWTSHSVRGKQIDWDCSGDLTEGQFEANISGDRNGAHNVKTVLAPHNEWERLNFTGGLLNRQQSLINKYSASYQKNLCYVARSPAEPNYLILLLQTLQGNRIYVPFQDVILPANDFTSELTPEKAMRVQIPVQD